MPCADIAKTFVDKYTSTAISGEVVDDGRDISVVVRRTDLTLVEARAFGKWLCEAADYLDYDLSAMQPPRNVFRRLIAKLNI